MVSSNIFLKEDAPRYYIGHGVVIAYLTICLLGGTVFVWLGLKRENKKRLSGARDNMLDGKTEEEVWIAGDNRPDFIYTM